MRTLSTSSRRRTLAICCAFFAAAMAVFVFGEPPEQTVFWDAVFDVGHALLFGFVMWLALSVFRRVPVDESHEGWNRVRALTATLVVAAASEVLQRFQPTRDPSVGDFLRDAAGASALLLFDVADARSLPGRVARRPAVLRLLAIAMLTAVLVPFAMTVRAYRERDQAFPSLARFDASDWERYFVSIDDADLVPAQSSGPRAEPDALALLRLRPARYSGVVVNEPFPDWSGFRRLRFDVVSYAESPMTLTIRVLDARYNGRDPDRFVRNVVLMGGPQTVEIPLDDVRAAPRGREMDLHRIRSVGLFVSQLRRPTDLALGPLRLE